jgi:hypothetical protein
MRRISPALYLIDDCEARHFDVERDGSGLKASSFSHVNNEIGCDNVACPLRGRDSLKQIPDDG